VPVIGRDSPAVPKRFEAVPRVPGEFVDGLGAGSMGDQTFDQLPAAHIALVRIFRAFHAEEFSMSAISTSMFWKFYPTLREVERELRRLSFPRMAICGLPWMRLLCIVRHRCPCSSWNCDFRTRNGGGKSPVG
jgi:hypothetical protein